MCIRKSVLILVLFLSISTIIKSQETGTLRGLVTDSTSGEPLAFSNVYIKELNIGASTDIHGYFLITSVPVSRELSLFVSYVGYRTKIIMIRIEKGKITHYNIKLTPSTVQMQTVEKVGERITERNETNISIERFNLKQLESMPRGIETDIFRSIKSLPGVQSTGDVSARYYVRGGSSNQNLVLIDGITIYNPFHALGLFSVVDPDVVNNVEFFKGGFNAEYGGRLSSLMMINTKDGNKNRYSAKTSASFISGKFFAEGPIPGGSFYLAGRKSFSNQVIKKFLNDQTVPVDFYDYSFKANFANPDFIEGAKFTVNAFASGDNLKNSDPRIEDFHWKSNAFGFKWFQVGDVPLFYELGISVSKFNGELIPKYSTVRASSNDVQDVSFNLDFTYTFENLNELGVGFHVKQLQTSLFYQNDKNIKTDLGNSAANIVFYVTYKIASLEYLKADIGMRFNLVPLVKTSANRLMEPRVNLNYKLLDGLNLKASTGIIQQELTTISDENEIINIYEPWVIAPNYIPSAYSFYSILGLQFNPNPVMELDLEGYYKKANNLSYLNDKKINILDSDFIKGDAESYGLESTLNYNLAPFNFSTSYTLAYAFKTIEGLNYYPKYDIRHSLNIILELNIGYGWQASAIWTYNSGMPYTQIVGYYDKLSFTDLLTTWDKYDPRNPYAILGVQNLGRLPVYHRLDLSLTKQFYIDQFKLEVGLSVLNVYDRKNIFYFKRDTGERVNMLPFLPSATVRVEL